MQPKVSIVVAAYNVEKYISRCINSLLNQTLEEIEILVINDGSKDNTVSVVDTIQKSDSRVKLITQSNGGLSAARNTGIDNAKGEFIAFLDGDDYVESNMYEMLYNQMVKEEADLSICNFYKVWENEKFEEQKRTENCLKTSLIEKSYITNFLTKHDEAFVVAWNKLFRLSIITRNKLKFENRAFFEDVGFIPRYLYFSRHITHVNEPLHFYIQRAGSITKSYNPIIEKSSENTINIVRDFFQDKINKDIIKAFELRLLIYQINYSLENKKNINILKNRVINLQKGRAMLPLKHRVAVLLLKYNLYEKIYEGFGR
ncbi:glycosyltransferase family 2 protein [Priestia aryabhattai]|uniref:glycosyltransferase family 2 protein n=1 Tax=Priestia aryabhattai TaxID=412384 RepID=UPI003D2E2822